MRGFSPAARRIHTLSPPPARAQAPRLSAGTGGISSQGNVRAAHAAGNSGRGGVGGVAHTRDHRSEFEGTAECKILGERDKI